MITDIYTNVNHLAFIPHGHCYLWQPSLVWLHSLSDGFIALAYFSIPASLIYFVRHRRDLPYPWIFLLFGTFIIACGLTHVMEIWTLWYPIYWVSGGLKVFTAIVSLTTASALAPIIPRALTLPNRSELEDAKRELERQVYDRTELLRRSEERLQLALAGSGDGLWDWNIVTGEVYFSPRWQTMLGYDDGELPGRLSVWQSLIHPDDEPLATELLQRHLQNEQVPNNFEYRLRHKSGKWQWIACYGRVVAHDKHGNPIRMVGTHKDISDRKQSELARKDSENRLQLALEASGEGLWDWNIEAGKVYLNARYEEMLGYTAGELNLDLESWRELIHPDDRQWVYDRLMAHLKDPSTRYAFDYRLRCKSGGWRWIANYGKVVAYDKQGNPSRMIGVHIDINDRKQTEVALAESQQRYQDLVKNSPDIIERFDLQLRHLYVSPALTEITGMSTDVFMGKTCRDLGMDEGMINAWEAAAARLLATGEKQVIEFSTPTLKGERSFEMAIAPERSSQQTVESILCISRDITDRKQTENQLRDLSTRLELAVQTAKMGIWDWDIVNDHQVWNDRTYELYGLPTGSPMDYATWASVIHPDDVADCLAASQKARAEDSEGKIEFRVIRPDGSLRHIESYFQIQRDAAGQPVRMIGVNLDISDRKQAEEARLQAEKLQLELNLLERILDSVLAGYWDEDLARQQIYLSPGLKHMLGYEDHELPNTPETRQELVFAEDLPGMLECFARHVQSRGEIPYYNEVRYRHKNGSTVWVICAGQVIDWDTKGQPLRVIGCHVDITKLKQAEAKILQTTAQLGASNRELEAFAYSVSHDLRAPLRAIDGFSKALLEDYGDLFEAEGKYFFDRIRHNVRRMGMLIDDLLNLSRVSRSEMQLTNVNLSKVVQEYADDLQSSDPKRQVEFVIAPDVIVSADLTLMRVVITNLLENAWKFTSHHSTAHIEFGIIKQNEQRIYFVRDDGAGFDMAYASKLFGVFQRLHNTEEFPGTGIGLATVQRSIHRHGGRVWAEAAVEQGTTIYFTIPDPSSGIKEFNL